VTDVHAASDRLGELLERFAGRIGGGPEGAAATLMRQAGVTASQLAVLSELARREAWTPSALARAVGMSAPAMSQMLERLQQMDLVDRMENPDDRRQRSISATQKGRVLVRRMRDARIRECAASVSKLNGVMKRELAEVMSRTLKAMEDFENFE
jgi:DNA-binding MarR family transcriptional regulator